MAAAFHAASADSGGGWGSTGMFYCHGLTYTSRSAVFGETHRCIQCKYVVYPSNANLHCLHLGNGRHRTRKVQQQNHRLHVTASAAEPPFVPHLRGRRVSLGVHHSAAAVHFRPHKARSTHRPDRPPCNPPRKAPDQDVGCEASSWDLQGCKHLHVDRREPVVDVIHRLGKEAPMGAR